jgi:hypothetical protein
MRKHAPLWIALAVLWAIVACTGLYIVDHFEPGHSVPEIVHNK